MSLYVQVVNGEVKQCWDTPPSEGVGNNGWKNAVEVRPAITAHRQGYTAHTFDISKDPVEIVYGTFDISVDERKGGMKGNAQFEFQRVVNQQASNPVTYDASAIEAARQTMVAKQAAIDACTTHDELDALL
jgi:hypothetical protein